MLGVQAVTHAMFTVIVSFCVLLILLKTYFKLCGPVLGGSNHQKFTWLVDGKDSGRQQQWAVITGASSGIGFQFSLQLARKGYHLMLISRSESKLAEAKKRIEADLKADGRLVEIRTLAADFTRLDIYEAISSFVNLKKNDVRVLVNNVGQCPPYPKLFTDELPADHDAMLHVNVLAATRMLQLILPSMVERGGGGGRLVINVASIAARHLFPLSSIYAATKAYIGQLSECLALEYRNRGITFCTLYPSAVSTAMIHNAREDFMTVSAERYVSSALASICSTTTGVHWTGYWTHSLVEGLANTIALATSREFVGTLIEHLSLGYGALVRQMQASKTDGLGNFNMWNALIQTSEKGKIH